MGCGFPIAWQHASLCRQRYAIPLAASAMSGLGFERATQDRVLRLFQEKLGYRYLDNWKDRAGNSNIEAEILSAYLSRRGYSAAEISGALYQLRGAADVSQTGLYEANRRVYSLLRYGVQVKAAADKPTTTVSLIDWYNPEANDFAIAEEVTLKGALERRQAAPRVEVHPRRLVLFVRPQSSLPKRQSILAAWYREELRKQAWPLIETWQQRLHVRCNKLFIQAMSRQWGSCNPVSRNIRLNTQLAQKPKCCLDYIILHELAHLRVPGHGDGFQALLNTHQPDWQERRALLNSLPLLSG